MKKTLTVLMTTVVALGFAQDTTIPFSQKNETIYVKVGVNESNLPKNDENIMPGFGVGYRTSTGHHGVDISTDANMREIRNLAHERVTNYSFTLPKVNYLFVLSPKSDNSFYAGAGLAVGGIQQTTVTEAKDAVINEEDQTEVLPAVEASQKYQEFFGLIPTAVVGYEFNRTGAVKTFVQFDVSQPALAVRKDGEFFTPKVAFSAGIGF
ncbi:MAG TPA: hypothetical protein VLE96_01440 [Chlamydiales bacterium]|nr:hypothetical protein [Chlamydiales bacterium]